MKKKVVWGPGKYTSATKSGSYGSFNEYLEKANKLRAEQEKAQSYLIKAMPALVKLLELRITKGEPLMVMRPLRYKTSMSSTELQKRRDQDDLDKSFYNTSLAQSAQNVKFVDVVETIYPGTKLIFKSLDPVLREFVFMDGLGNEHAISYDERNAILTQTDLFETVQKLFEGE